MKKKIFLMFLFLFLAQFLNAQDKSDSFNYDSKGKRDPLMPLVSTEGYLVSSFSIQEVDKLKLEGIVYGRGKDNYAIINSSVFKEGESVGEYKVVGITKDKVTLTKDSEEIVLELESESQEEEPNEKNENNQ